VAQLLRSFQEFSAARGRSPSTLHGNARIIERVLIPALGSTRVEDLTAFDLDSLYSQLATRAPRPLSAASIRRYHSVISAALAQAVRWGWLEQSVASRATLPHSSRRELEVPTAEQVNDLIEASSRRSTTLGMFVAVAAVTGCRRGEIAALRWLDLRDDTLVIRASAYAIGATKGIKSTKSGRTRRILIGPALGAELVAWRARCETLAARHGLAYGDDAFLFAAGPDGAAPVNVNTMTSTFRSVADSLGLVHVHLHSLRHFAATNLIASGLDVRDAATRMGHSSAVLTLNVYGHATELRQREASIADNVLERRQRQPDGPEVG
jgi:integrase